MQLVFYEKRQPINRALEEMQEIVGASYIPIPIIHNRNFQENYLGKTIAQAEDELIQIGIEDSVLVTGVYNYLGSPKLGWEKAAILFVPEEFEGSILKNVSISLKER